MRSIWVEYKKYQQSPVGLTTAGGARYKRLKGWVQPALFYLPRSSDLCLYSFHSARINLAMFAVYASARRISKKVSIGVTPFEKERRPHADFAGRRILQQRD